MRSQRWWLTGAPALTGIAAGIVIIICTEEPRAIGQALFTGGLGVLVLTMCKKWLTDTSFEKQRLRYATLASDEALQQAQVGRALQFAERERDRRVVEETKQDADRRIVAAEDRADQAEVNSSMRAYAAEKASERRADEGIAAANKRADDRIAAMRRELADERMKLMLSQYKAGVLDERNGNVAAVLAAMDDANLIHLDDHRPPTPAPGKTADGGPR